MEGFKHQFKKILRLADEIPDCNPVPVTGMSLLQDSLEILAYRDTNLMVTINPVDDAPVAKDLTGVDAPPAR